MKLVVCNMVKAGLSFFHFAQEPIGRMTAFVILNEVKSVDTAPDDANLNDCFWSNRYV
jgi:hypothetical protein